MASHLKKERARGRAAAPGRAEATPGMVRRTARSRSREAHLHRRDRRIDQSGAQRRSLPAWPTAARQRAARPLQDGHARRRRPPARARGAESLRPADQRRPVRGMGGDMSCPHALERRRRRHGQLASAQGAAGREAHQSRRRRAALSAALQPRHEPDREGVLQAQSLLAQNRRAYRRRPHARPRSLRRYLQTRRMHKLFCGLWIRYNLIGYRSSTPHALSEQVIQLASGEVSEQLRKELTEIIDWLHARLDVRPVRIPHGEILPGVRDGILTVVVQDQRRSLPVARLYCYEEIKELGSQVEQELRMEATDFTSKQLAVWKWVREKIKGMAWV